MASIRWVRPDLHHVRRTARGLAAAARAASVLERRDQRALAMRSTAAMWMAAGNRSLERLRRVHVVVGVRPRPPRRAAPTASVGEHLVDVHVWSTCPTRSGTRRPGTRRAERPRRPASAAAPTGPPWPPVPGTRAALGVLPAAMRPLDARQGVRRRRGTTGRPEIGKFSTARWVWARRGRPPPAPAPPSSRARCASAVRTSARPRSCAQATASCFDPRLGPRPLPWCLGSGRSSNRSSHRGTATR